ncbi:leucine-rich repeat domain-containing protein [Lactococcus hodotermopsidis]|uniref:leucine-rich repeat domain-containing protein n=1 Tax=Pseudolactococcus hodotermopsidis TaxID=2709157 RepID=UPI00155800F8
MNVNAVTELTVNKHGIKDLTGINLFKNLTYLHCGTNQLESIDISGLKKLQYLDCHYNYLTSLNVSGLTELKELQCYHNELKSLDVSNLLVDF